MYLNTVFKYNVFEYCLALLAIFLSFSNDLFLSAPSLMTETHDLSSTFIYVLLN